MVDLDATYPIKTNASLLTMVELRSMFASGIAEEVKPAICGLESRNISGQIFAGAKPNTKSKLGLMSTVTHIKFGTGSVITNHVVYLFNIAHLFRPGTSRILDRMQVLQEDICSEIGSPLLRALMVREFPIMDPYVVMSPDIFFHSFTGPVCGIVIPQGHNGFPLYPDVCTMLGWSPHVYELDPIGGFHRMTWSAGKFISSGKAGLAIMKMIVSPFYRHMPGLESCRVAVSIEHGGQCIPPADFTSPHIEPWGTEVVIRPRVVLDISQACEDIVRSSQVT